MSNTMDNTDRRISDSSTTDTLVDDVPSSPENPTLLVNFTWKKFKALVTETNSDTPKYVVDYRTFRYPNILFHHYGDKTQVFGSGTPHPVSINARYELHGRKMKLKALRRWYTRYTHLSYAYSDNADGSPVAMTWTSKGNFKTWDFICLDENKNPVAKFSANCWALKKMGNIEFIGPKANDPACREEILVVGLTLFSCMVLRINNILNFFGAIFARTGPLDKDTETVASKRTSQYTEGKSGKYIEEKGQTDHMEQGLPVGERVV